MKKPDIEMLCRASEWIRINEGDDIHGVADWIDHHIKLMEEKGQARAALISQNIKPTPGNVKKLLNGVKKWAR